MAKAYGVVYYIVNTINGKMYVGQTTQSLEIRFSEHAYHKKSAIDKAIRKYNKENFRYGLIKSCDSKAEMDKWEKFFIIALNTKGRKGYNQTDGGEGLSGWKHKPESCAKMSVANIGKERPLEYRAKISLGLRNESPYKNLIAEMDKQKLTYVKFAKLLKLARTSISLKMNGKRNFTKNQIAKLVEIFGKPAEFLLQRDDGKNAISKYYRTPFKNLLYEIEKRKFTYTALANILGYGQSVFSVKMLGRCNFTERDKAKLAEFFGKPIEYLMFKEEF